MQLYGIQVRQAVRDSEAASAHRTHLARAFDSSAPAPHQDRDAENEDGQ